MNGQRFHTKIFALKNFCVSIVYLSFLNESNESDNIVMNESKQGLGKGMIYAAWLVALGLLTLFFNHFLDKQNNPNQELTTRASQEGGYEVILQRNRSGHYVASGTINDKPVVFFLDTGATVVSIPSSIADNLNLQRGTPRLSSTANGTITTYSTTLDSIALGPIKLHQVPADINPYMLDDEILLGMSFLKHLDFSQRGDMMILRHAY